MLFHEDYQGTEPQPEKTGFRRFLEIIQYELITLVKVNLFFLLSCIPIVTIPPAVFAIHRIVWEIVLDQPVERYGAAFRRSWKAGYCAFLLTAVPMGLAGFGAVFYLRHAAEHLILFVPFMLCATVFLATMLSSTYLYGLLCRDKPVGEAVRSALTMGLAKPLRAVLASVCRYGLMLAGLLCFPMSGVYLLLIGFSLPCLLGCFYARTVLKEFYTDLL